MSTPKATERDNQELSRMLSLHPMWKKKMADAEDSQLPETEKERIRKGGEAFEKRLKELQAMGAKAPPA
jgi:hypothetical protein